MSEEQREVKRRFEEKEREQAQRIAKEERLAEKRVLNSSFSLFSFPNQHSITKLFFKRFFFLLFLGQRRCFEADSRGSGYCERKATAGRR